MLDLDALICFPAASAMPAPGFVGKRGVAALGRDAMAGMARAASPGFGCLSDTSCRRAFFPGTAFLLHGMVILSWQAPDFKDLLLIFVLYLHLYNIPPRNRALRIVTFHGVGRQGTKEKGGMP